MPYGTPEETSGRKYEVNIRVVGATSGEYPLIVKCIIDGDYATDPGVAAHFQSFLDHVLSSSAYVLPGTYSATRTKVFIETITETP